MNIENEVLPCPFCGSSDISDGEVLTEYPSGRVTKQSMCRDCMALGAEAVLDKDEIDYGSVKAIAAWNKRKQLAQQPSVDVLVEALHWLLGAIDESVAEHNADKVENYTLLLKAMNEAKPKDVK